MNLLRNRNGQGLTEYMILLTLIGVTSIVAVTSLGNTVREKIQQARKQINGVSSYR
jgi:Flp pilus assembly pilin Flp